jgi:hypothetical protein
VTTLVAELVVPAREARWVSERSRHFEAETERAWRNPQASFGTGTEPLSPTKGERSA